jgi:hypothetical protein
MTGWRKRQVLDIAREAWAKAGEKWVVDAWFDDRSKAFEAFAALVREDEREACAKVCEDSFEYAGDDLAQRIRARGQA